MTKRKVVYLVVRRGAGFTSRTILRPIGSAQECRDGSLDLKLDFHPGLIFNVREPKSNEDAEAVISEVEDEL